MSSPAPDPMEKLRAFGRFFTSRLDAVLIDKAGETARISYSVIGLYVLIMLQVVPEALHRLIGWEYDPYAAFKLILGVSVFILVARFIRQPASNRWRRRFIVFLLALCLIAWALPPRAWAAAPAPVPAPPTDMVGSAQFDALAFDLISRWEGLELCAYRDLVGVLTIGYGHTRTVQPGQCITPDRARELLLEEIGEYRADLRPYFTLETQTFRLPAPREVAFVSLAYNAGPDRIGRSTAMRRLNANRIRGSCEALTWWNRAGGRVVRGLVRRRAAERDLCLRGLT